MTISRRLATGGGAYVAAVTTLAGVATTDLDRVVLWAWLVALALTVPSIVILVPAVYLVLPVVWRLTDIDHGGPTWPSTVAYMVCFGGAAVLNLVVVRLIATRRRARRTVQAPVPSPH